MRSAASSTRSSPNSSARRPRWTCEASIPPPSRWACPTDSTAGSTPGWWRTTGGTSRRRLSTGPSTIPARSSSATRPGRTRAPCGTGNCSTGRTRGAPPARSSCSGWPGPTWTASTRSPRPTTSTWPGWRSSRWRWSGGWTPTPGPPARCTSAGGPRTGPSPPSRTAGATGGSPSGIPARDTRRCGSAGRAGRSPSTRRSSRTTWPRSTPRRPRRGPGRSGCGSGSPTRRSPRSRRLCAIPGTYPDRPPESRCGLRLSWLRFRSETLLYIYAEFKVEIRRGREGRHGHRVTVECEKPDGGRVGPTDAQPITTSVTRLIPAASAEQRIDLGEELGQCMFPPRVLAAFTETLRGLDAGTGIRVRLLCVDEEMARWPWELARIAVPAKARPRYLFRDERFSLVRTVIDHRPAAQPKERRKLVILTVDATKVLDDQELEPDFPEQLAHTAPLQRLDLSHPTRRTIDELIDQVVDGEDPLDIFHFTGHGRAPRDGQAGALVLYRDQDTGIEHYRGDELAKQLHR